MNTNHELDRLVEDWLDDRVVEPQLDGLHETLSHVLTTPQTRARFLGRWFDRGGGDRRHADADGYPPGSARRMRLMLTTTGVAAAIAVLALAINTLPNGEAETAVFEASGTVLTVATDGTGDHDSIAEAIAAAGNGDEISVAPGTYAQTLLVDKNVAITGNGAPGDVILAGDQEEEPYAIADAFDCVATCAVLVEGASPRFTDLTFAGPVRVAGGGPTLERVAFEGVGLAVSDTRLVLRDSTLTVQGLGIKGSTDVTVEDNSFSDGADIITFSASGSARVAGNEFEEGLIVVGSPLQLTIEDNTFRGSGDYWEHGGSAIHVGLDGHSEASDIKPMILDNRFEGGKMGIVVDAKTSPHIEGNEFVGLSMGLRVSRSAAHITGNSITDSTSGIVVVSSGAPTITDNVIDVTGRGIVVGANTSPVIEGNTVCGGEHSIYIADTATPDLGDNQTCEAGVTG